MQWKFFPKIKLNNCLTKRKDIFILLPNSIISAITEGLKFKFWRKRVMVDKKKAVILGSAGMKGQKYLQVLKNHPFIEIVQLCDPNPSVSTLGSVKNWFSGIAPDDPIFDMKIDRISELNLSDVDFIFSGLREEDALKIENELAIQKPLFTTSPNFRMEPDVPLFLPIINGDHYQLLDTQKEKRGWKGFILANPNCTASGLAISTYPIFKQFGIKSLTMTSMQSISGADYPGLSAYDISGNIIPYIEYEETKVVNEIKKIFGVYQNGQIIAPDFLVDCKCNRVPVLNGHLESVFIQTINDCSVEDIKQVLSEFKGATGGLGLPNAPEHPIVIMDDPDRPQPRLELSRDPNAMSIFVGGITKSNFKNGFKFTSLTNNSVLGSAKGSVLSAEFLIAKNYL
jgi:aspartate-semialdehyde dehydrogenase